MLRILGRTDRGLIAWARSSSSPAQVFIYVGSGGIQFGGAAATSVQHAHPYTGSGGLVFGGAAITSRTSGHVYVGAGGLSFGGAGGTGKLVYIGSGGIVFGGAAQTVAAAATLQRGKSAVRVSAKASGAIRIG